MFVIFISIDIIETMIIFCFFRANQRNRRKEKCSKWTIEFLVSAWHQLLIVSMLVIVITEKDFKNTMLHHCLNEEMKQRGVWQLITYLFIVANWIQGTRRSHSALLIKRFSMKIAMEISENDENLRNLRRRSSLSFLTGTLSKGTVL